ncbi:serine/threonine protein kinase [Mycolicibacterium moriokaense]|nr:serine/threonine protein kinase [Mycolicibacterium moriokaense]
MLHVGEEFEGYVVDATLGRGGYATVYLAHAAAEPNHAVALKVLDDHHRGGDQTTRLRREFEFAHQLDHPSVIRVYQRGNGWLTMELVNGDASTVLTERTEQLAALAQIASALDYIHQRGIVHCDVKPSNILVSQPFRRAVLIDFGVAYTVAETVWWRSDHLEASLPYAAPELLRGRPPSALSDQYSLACTAVELLLGAPPFAADTPMGMMDAHVSRPPPSYSHKIAWAPRIFDSVLHRALAKLPDSRYDSCSEFVEQLDRALS